jgi:hypothetical protein
MKNKRDFEIFIGSLPTNADERELSEYFASKKVKITNIRVLRSTICVMQTIEVSRSAWVSDYAWTRKACARPWTWTATGSATSPYGSTWRPKNEMVHTYQFDYNLIITIHADCPA